MYIVSISPSSYNTLDECEMKYYIGNVLKIREPAGAAAERGTIVHNFFEILALHKKAQQENQKTIKNKVYGTEPVQAEDPMQIDIDDLFDKCWNYYVEKSIHKYDDKLKKETFGWAKSALDTNEDPRKLHIISAEQYYSFLIEEPWAKYEYWSNTENKVISGYYTVNLIIDLIVQNPDGSVKFIDWKTAQRKDWITGKRKEYEDLYKDIQLNIYNYVLHKIYPDKTVHVCIVYLKDGGAFDFIFTPKSREDTLKRVKKQMERARAITIPRQVKSYKCRWCFYSKGKLPDAPKEYRKGQFDDIGETMCLCSDIHERIKKDGISKTSQDLYKKEVK